MLDSSATAQPPVAPTLRVLLTLAWPVVLARATQPLDGTTAMWTSLSAKPSRFWITWSSRRATASGTELTIA